MLSFFHRIHFDPAKESTGKNLIIVAQDRFTEEEKTLTMRQSVIYVLFYFALFFYLNKKEISEHIETSWAYMYMLIDLYTKIFLSQESSRNKEK